MGRSTAVLNMASIDPLRNRGTVKAILIAGFAAVSGLHVINSTTDFYALSPNSHQSVYRMEAFGLTLYTAALIFAYFLAMREREK